MEKTSEPARRRIRDRERYNRTLPCNWELRLYVAGETVESAAILDKMNSICAEYLKGTYRLQVIDLYKNPELTPEDSVLAVSAATKSLPHPLPGLLAELVEKERVLIGLEIRPIKK